MSLDLLPAEVLHDIIRLLDPIGLISLSQSNSCFRRVINPQKHHFAERLLALEVVHEYGGAALVYHSRTNTLTPDSKHESWKAMRWACTDCLRLLPHQNFDNHFLVGLAYRKPTSDSPAATLITTWEPSLLGKRWGRSSKKTKISKFSPEEISRRKFYSIAVGVPSYASPPAEYIPATLLQHEVGWYISMTGNESGLFGLLQILENMDQYALSYERDHCGYNRKLRKCNECRYQRGQLRPRIEPRGRGMALGTARVPIMPSRSIAFGIALDRFFPDLSRVLQAKRPPFDPPLYNTEPHGDRWVLRMVRCPGCSRWQEMREFRFCGWNPGWRPTLDGSRSTWDDRVITEAIIERSCCNNCFAKKHGSQKLSVILLAWFNYLIEIELKKHTDLLLCGFSWLRSSSNHRPFQCELKQSELNKIIIGAITAGRKYEAGEKEVSIMKAAHKKIVPFVEQLLKVDRIRLSLDDEMFTTWLSDFDQVEEFWKWTKACQEEVKANPLLLVEWALSRDGATLY